MILPFNTDRMAAKFGKWRGPVTVALAVGICMAAALISRLADLVFVMDEPSVSASSIVLTAIVVYCLGALFGIWGTCLFALDALRGSYIEAAARHSGKGQ